MNHFEPGPEGLACEGVPLAAVAKAVGTPAYVYSTATLERHYRVFEAALQARPATRGALIAFAVKANSNLSVLSTLARLGAGADTVSEGEIRRSLVAGVAPERIVFSGVGKTAREMAFALDAGVGQFNVESEAELKVLAAVAGDMGLTAEVALRVNPDVGAGGHAKISTGAGESKFGVSISEARRLYALAARTRGLRVRGLACHIGSQIVDLEPLREAYGLMRALVLELRGDGLAVETIDLGGGLGVPYFQNRDPPAPDALVSMAAEAVDGLGARLIIEPGRAIAANAGVLLSRVVHVHARADARRFLVLDAGMNDLIRPAMYDAWHDIRPVVPRPGAPVEYDVVGPVCETSDTFARARRLAPLEAGDLVAFMTAGAYGAVMSSEYNSRPLVPEVLVRGEAFAIVRARPTYEAMLSRESLAPWLVPAAESTAPM